MEKLLHERLREYANDGHSLACDDFIKLVGRKCNQLCSDCRAKTFNRFAEEIEHYYLPRPRFEDGEPVQFGDAMDWADNVEAITFYDTGAFDINDGNCGVAEYGGDSFVGRPQLKVLDADGAPIKVGDTVYPLSGAWIGSPLEVTEIIDSYYIRLIIPESQLWTSYHCKKVSHKEPDSLEKIYDEMSRTCSSMVQDWAKRLSAIIERSK